MTIISIKRDDAVELLDAAVKRNKPITIVKDQGCYAMVFGDGKSVMQSINKNNVVKYFIGFDPKKNVEWYDKSIFVFGYDDFGMDIDDIKWFKTILKYPDWKHLRVHVTAKSIKLSVK